MALKVLHSDLLVYEDGFLSNDEHDALLEWLDRVPTNPSAGHDVTATFAFASPTAGATRVRHRREAAAGWPVWTDGGPGRGVAMPPSLAQLASSVHGRLVDQLTAREALPDPVLPFTSVYVDRYPPGGSFVPHTDRRCYGPLVAGVSVGPGSCVLEFTSEADRPIIAKLVPRSLYAFAGGLRREPCTHAVRDVTDLRYGITLRSAVDPVVQ